MTIHTVLFYGSALLVIALGIGCMNLDHEWQRGLCAIGLVIVSMWAGGRF